MLNTLTKKMVDFVNKETGQPETVTTVKDCKVLTVSERMTIFATTVKLTHDIGSKWIEGKTKRYFTGERGEVNMNALLVMALMAAVVFIVLANLWPSMQSANTTIQANTATDTGTVTSKTIFGLLLWIIPLGIGIALVIRVLHHE